MDFSQYWDTADSGANASVTLNFPPLSAGQTYAVSGFAAFVWGAVAGADIIVTIVTDSTGANKTKWKGIIGSGSARGSGLEIDWSSAPRECLPGKDVQITATAAGAGAVVTVDLQCTVVGQ